MLTSREQLALVTQGAEAWNQWRKKNDNIRPHLSRANLSEVELARIDFSQTDLYHANLTKTNFLGANFIEADLSQADLSQANLNRANLKDADLSRANLAKANLSEADLSKAELRESNLTEANLSEADLSGAYLAGADFNKAYLFRTNLSETDLSETNLNKAILHQVILSGQDLSRKNFSGVDLRGANLSRIQALGTNFEGANLTGACIEDWSINSKTNLNGVICDYVYLKQSKQERRPSDPDKNFAPGEFTKLFQKALETVDLIFKDGINWQAFLTSFQKLQVECGSKELAIQAIERKPGDAFVVRVEVPPDANKAEIEKFFKRKYGLTLKAKEKEYKKLLQAKDKDIVYFRQQNTNLLDIIKVQASKPINITQIQGNNMAGDRNIKMGSGNYNEKIEGDYYEQKGNFGIGHMSGGEISEGAKVAGVINEAQQQDLAQAAAEIQKLLKQLEESYPTSTTAEQMIVATKAIEQIESNPDLKQRAVNALKQGSLKALETHPIGAFVVGAIKGWQKVSVKSEEKGEEITDE